MQIWEYSGNYYLKIIAVKPKEVQVENAFGKIILILCILFFQNAILRRKVSRLQVIVFLWLLYTYIYIYKMGLSESSF